MRNGTLSLQKSLSKVLPNSKVVTLIEILFLLFIGMTAITLHAKLRMPMHLPGKHGLTFMFMIIAGWSVSSVRYAALTSCIGAAALLFTNVLGFGDPFIAGTYLVLGFVLDILLNSSLNLQSKIWFVALVSGLSYMIIPLTRLFLSMLTGFQYGSLITGSLYPISTHFVFGFTGGLLAILAAKGLEKMLNSKY